MLATPVHVHLCVFSLSEDSYVIPTGTGDFYKPIWEAGILPQQKTFGKEGPGSPKAAHVAVKMALTVHMCDYDVCMHVFIKMWQSEDTKDSVLPWTPYVISNTASGLSGSGSIPTFITFSGYCGQGEDSKVIIRHSRQEAASKGHQITHLKWRWHI